MGLQDAWSLQNLHLAWRRLTTGRNLSYKRYFRNLYYAYEIGLKDNIRDLHARLKGGSYQPQPPTKLYLPKSSGLQRPITLLCIEDQIVLQAITNLFSRKLLRRRRKLEHKCVFSNIVEANDESIFFLQDWRISYSKFQAKIIEDFNAGYRWIAHFDLAAYYDTICHDLLLRTAFPRIKDDENRARIIEWLKAWSSELTSSGHAHGIPQGPIASDFLAECFLLPVDEILHQTLKYVRYVDDIRLFAKSENEVRKAAIEMEIVLRGRGLIPQGKKHEITHAKTPDDAMGILPSIDPRDDGHQTEERVMPKKDAIRIFRSALSGKPLVVIDKTRARYVLYHSDPSSKLLGYVLRLMPRHPEHIDALVYYLSQHKASQRVVRKCAEILQTSPYEYVRGEMWHILARMMKPQQMRGHLTRAVDIAKDKQAGFALKWGACHFLCGAERAGLGKYAKFVMSQQNPLLQALLVPVMPDGRFGRNDVAEKLLRRSAIEPGLALAEPFVRLGLTHLSYGLQAKSLPKQVQNVFKTLGIIKGPISAIDPLGEILSRRYGIAQWDGWKTLLRSEYAYALQLLAIADSAYHIARSQWLSYMNSFNHSLFIALQGYLEANHLSGVMKTKDKNGKLINFGSLLDADKPFASHYPIIAEGLQDANSRRNKLPASHPYEVIGGARARHLGKHEQASLTEKLSKAYQEILSLLSSP
jgi:retron-type reverse transcriptase